MTNTNRHSAGSRAFSFYKAKQMNIHVLSNSCRFLSKVSKQNLFLFFTRYSDTRAGISQAHTIEGGPV